MKIWKYIVFSLLILSFAGMVYGAFAIDRPDTNEYVHGAAYIINGTPWVGDAYSGNCTNVSLDYRVSGGSTYTYIGKNVSVDVDNITADWSVVFDTRALKDDTTYSLRARCINESNSVVLTTATEVTFKVDNTVPVVVTPSPSTGTEQTDGSYVAFSITCTNSSSADLYLDNAKITMTESSDVCSYTMDWLTDGLHSWYVIASDGRNSTTSSTYNIRISKGGGYIPEEAQATSTGQTSNTALLVVLGAVVWLVWSGKSTTKRRRKR